jgi:hypothetical protein
MWYSRAHMKSLLMVVVATTACASGVTDDLAGESETDGAIGKADSASNGVYTYYQIHASGSGYMVARLNRSTTTCADGTTKPNCFAPTLDWSETPMSVTTQQKLLDAAAYINESAIVRGRFATKAGVSRFVVAEAWVAESSTAPGGVFAKVTNSGITCITTPCPTMKEHSLNNSFTANIAAIDWSYADLSAHEIAAFTIEIASDYGTIIAGDRYYLSHSMKARTATAAFHRLVEDGPCYRGGCSDELCSDQQGLVSSCIWKPIYACDEQATCERQGDGTCGLTHDAAYDTCVGGL